MPPSLDDIERSHLRDPDDRTFTITRRLPPARLEPWLRRYWIPVWDVPEGSSAEQKVLQYPVCLAVITPSYARFIGPNPGLSTTVLEGRSWAFGVMFSPAAGSALLGGPVSGLTGTWCELDAIPVLSGLVAPCDALMDAAPEDPATHAACCRLLEERMASLGGPDEEDLLVNRLVETVENDDELVSVAQLCGRIGLGERTLQRLTARRLGLSPVWLIRRRRLHEAAGRLRTPVALAELAARLGYADQAHFARDFHTSTGMTPGRFARRWRREDSE